MSTPSSPELASNRIKSTSNQPQINRQDAKSAKEEGSFLVLRGRPTSRREIRNQNILGDLGAKSAKEEGIFFVLRGRATSRREIRNRSILGDLGVLAVGPLLSHVALDVPGAFPENADGEVGRPLRSARRLS
jgi:hypothetical protein